MLRRSTLIVVGLVCLTGTAFGQFQRVAVLLEWDGDDELAEIFETFYRFNFRRGTEENFTHIAEVKHNLNAETQQFLYDPGDLYTNGETLIFSGTTRIVHERCGETNEDGSRVECESEPVETPVKVPLRFRLVGPELTIILEVQPFEPLP